MAGAKREVYSLYQTFDENIPDRNLTTKETNLLIKNMKILDLDQKIACLRLIIEHSVVCDDIASVPDDLPFGGVETDDGSPSFSLTAFPIELKWILFKFTEMTKLS